MLTYVSIMYIKEQHFNKNIYHFFILYSEHFIPIIYNSINILII